MIVCVKTTIVIFCLTMVLLGIPTTSSNVTVNLPQRQEPLNPEEESSVRALYTAFMPQHLQVRNCIILHVYVLFNNYSMSPRWIRGGK